MTLKGFRDPFAKLLTPSPEPALTHKDSEQRDRSPWNAGGYSLALSIEAQSHLDSTSSFRSSNDNSEPDITYGSSSTMSASSRNGSLDSVPTSQAFSMAATYQAGTQTAHVEDTSAEIFMADARKRASHDAFTTDFSNSRHKFSGSQSSLSSISSSHSSAHSRVSSVTTVSGTHALVTPLLSGSYFDSKLGAQAEPESASFESANPPSPAPSNAHPPPDVSACETKEEDEASQPASPSDAVIRMRSISEVHADPRNPRRSLHHPASLSSSTRFHKRAISAPDYTLSRTRFFPQVAHNSSIPSRRTMSSLQSQNESIAEYPEDAVRNELLSEDAHGTRREAGNSAPLSPFSQPPSRPCHTRARTELSLPIELVGSVPGSSISVTDRDEESLVVTYGEEHDEEEEEHCMFVKNCDTGSQLRKAISHLFGRNKSCTLRIPKHVWVYYCRKHYQRIRYRNARTYPVNQMELVKVQIRRLQAWSRNNVQNGTRPYIKSWTLSLRKREKNRIDNEKENAGDGEDDTTAGQSGMTVPDWLIQRLGNGLSTELILETAERLHADIAAGILSQVPEIEFLPDIVEDEAGESGKSGSSRRHARSKSRSKTPKRKAPEAPGLPNNTPDRGHYSLLASREEEEPSLRSIGPGEKRRRLDDGFGVSDPTSSRLPAISQALSSSLLCNASGEKTQPPSALQNSNLLPRRAGHIVPKFPAPGHNPRSSTHERETYGQRYPSHMHTGSLDGSQHISHINRRHGELVQSQDQSPSRFNAGYGNDGLPVTLPSISTQVPQTENFHGQAPREVTWQSQSRGPVRFTHQRSASAVTPSSQYGPTYGHMSSSSNDSQVALPHVDSLVGGQSYRGGPENYAQHNRGHRQGWSYDYGLGFAANQQPSSQHRYGYQPLHGVDEERAAAEFTRSAAPAAPSAERRQFNTGGNRPWSQNGGNLEYRNSDAYGN